MASRAGTRCIDLQFVQFHPTALFHPSGRFLISESLRGEGARLVDNNGMEFMSEFHAHGSLAPRDVACARILPADARIRGTLCLPRYLTSPG
jgi:L-aspartate oxidase